jgi:hypothetical protein
MHFEAHASLGWVIGNSGATTRRLRAWCVLGAVLPDIDAVPYVFGAEAYGRWHHTFGHNIFLWGLFALVAAWHCRSWAGLAFAGAAFGSHLLTDAFFSGWKLYLLWPLSQEGFLPRLHVGLEHPVNLWLIYAGLAAVLGVAMLRKRTPLEMVSPRLDRVVVALFQAKPLACFCCGRPANQRCGRCGRPICARHARLVRGADLACPNCPEAAARS